MPSSEDEQNLQETYNKISVQWAATNSDPNFWANEFLKFSLYLPAGLVLDVGCGVGRAAGWFTEHGYGYAGVDASPQMVQIAQTAYPDCNFFVQNFYELKFEDSCFDGFWAAISLLHVPKEKINIPMAEINRVCKTGAIGFIGIREGEGVGMVQWETTGRDRFFAYYSRKEFSVILEKNGFEVMEVDSKTSLIDPEANFLVFYVRKA